MDRDKSRREFLGRLLKGRLSPEEAGPGRAEQDESRPLDRGAARPQKGLYKLTIGRKAMATDFQVIFNLGQYENATEAALAALDLLEPLEDMMSFFRPTGELGRVNARADEGDVTISDELCSLLQYCHQLWEITNGAFDITAAPLWQVWGFARRQGRLPSDHEIAEARKLCGWRWVQLDPDRRTIRFLKKGVALNLGSIGKGYAVDRMADVLEKFGTHDWIIHGGLSSVKASGSSWEVLADDSQDKGWPVGLSDPLHRGARLGQIWLKDSALGTSGTALQFFWHKGKRYGHILDPRTGYPAGEGLLSTTVIAPTATAADALATAFFILGREETACLCQERADLSVIFIAQRGSGEVEVDVIGAPVCFDNSVSEAGL